MGIFFLWIQTGLNVALGVLKAELICEISLKKNNEGGIKMSSDERKLKELIADRSAWKEILQGVLQTEGK